MNALAAAGAAQNTAGTIIGIVIDIVIFLAYWVPTIVALCRWKDIPNGGGVIVVNAFLGWTGVGWVVALVMAVKSRPQPVQYTTGFALPPPYPPQAWPQPQAWHDPRSPQP